MLIGYVKWFGGFNKKSQKVNNFGFMVPFDGLNNQDIKVYRDDVPEDIQKILERKDARGIYVKFNIEKDRKVREKVVNIELLKFLGVVEKIIINNNNCKKVTLIRYEDDLISQNTNVAYSSECLPQGSIVYFYLCYNDKNNNSVRSKEYQDRAIDVKKVELLKSDNYLEIVLKSSTLRKKLIEYSTFEEYIFIIDKSLDKIDSCLADTLVKELMTKIEARQWLSINQIKIIKNQKIIENCVNSNNPDIFKAFLLQHIKTLPQQKAIDFLLLKINFMLHTDKCEFIKEVKDEIEYLLVESSNLREVLYESTIADYLQFIKTSLEFKEISEVIKKTLLEEVVYKYQASDQNDKIVRFLMKHSDLLDESLKLDVLDKMIQYLQKSSPSERLRIWDEITYFSENLEYEGQFWDIAPDKYTKQILQQKFRIFFDLVEQFNQSVYPYADATKGNYHEFYKMDNNEDIKLIEDWLQDNTLTLSDNDDKVAQMIAARGAEKLVIKYYEALGYEVDDISVHQVTKKSDDYLRYDIRINKNNEEIFIDVKNARRFKPNKFSRFCVKRLKEQEEKNIKISGVISPHLQRKYIQEPYLNDPDLLKLKIERLKVLGVFDKQTMESMKEDFKNVCQRLQLNFKFDVDQHIKNQCDKNQCDINKINFVKFYPHWIFDYENDFYKKQFTTNLGR